MPAPRRSSSPLSRRFLAWTRRSGTLSLLLMLTSLLAFRSAIADWYDRGVFPKELAREMGEVGLLGMHLEGYGCAGTSAVSYGLACLEMEAGDSGFRSFVSVQGSLAMFPIWAYGSEEQKSEWLPRMAACRRDALR